VTIIEKVTRKLNVGSGFNRIETPGREEQS